MMFKRLFSASGAGASKIANLYRPSTWRAHGWIWRILLVLGTLLAINFVLMFLWSKEPAMKSLDEVLSGSASRHGEQATVTGEATTATTIHLLDQLIHKSGGFISNDVMPPGIMMDNMQSWEYGVLLNLRELSKAFRYDFSRSQSQSSDDKDLIKVENGLRIDSEAWMLPAAEAKYQEALDHLIHYEGRLLAGNNQDRAYFYSRADNLEDYLSDVSKTLGALTQELSASVGINAVDERSVLIPAQPDKAPNTANKTQSDAKKVVRRTPWRKIDDKFFEARGYCWALIQTLRAFEKDFAKVLDDKNAVIPLRQTIRELEATQSMIWSPFIMNGDGFGVFANHSLVMASYMSRANATLIDLNTLLRDG